jgi:uncharacterized protein (TIGR00369 family)
VSEAPEIVAAQWREFDPVSFFALTRRYGHGSELGIRYEQHGEDWIELSLPWREELVGVPESGLLASGAIISLVDMAAGLSVWTKVGVFKPMATLDLRIDYLRPALKGETVFAHCRCIRTTRSVAFVQGVAHVGDRDDPIATAALTFMPT